MWLSSSMMRLPRPQVVSTVFALVLILKLSLVRLYGPIFVPDTMSYVAFAKEMMASTAWLHDAQLASGIFPLLAIHMVGYPAVLALATQIGGDSWPYLILALQFVITMGALWAVYRLGLALRLPWGLALAAMVAFATSDDLVIDQCILTDSLNADVVIFAVGILASGACCWQPLSLPRAASAGALLAAAFLLREAMPFLAITLLPLLAIRWWSGRAQQPIRSTLACALVLLPLVGTMEAYEAWNQHRTGERFVTTTAQAGVLFALVVAAQYDHGVFDGDTPLDLAARPYLRDYGFAEVTPINVALIKQGYPPNAIAHMAQAHYLATWWQRPWAMLHVLRRHTSENVAKLAFRPIAATCTLVVWATHEQPCPDYRDLARAARTRFSGQPFDRPWFFLFQTCELALSIALFSAFFLGTPVLFVLSWRREGLLKGGRESLMLALWAMYVGWFLIYGVVHLEHRYLIPVIPFSILGGLVVWYEMLRVPVRLPASRRNVLGHTTP